MYALIEENKNPYLFTNTYGEDLDSLGYWVNLPREADETDEHYKYRLKDWMLTSESSNTRAIENSILYVEPVYKVLLNEGTQVPTLKKVIVASGTKVAIGDDLAEALTTLLTDSAGKIEFVNTDDKEQLINAIIKASKNLKESTESKDWELIGSDIDRLQTLIDQLENVQEQEKSTSSKSGILDNIME